MTFHTSILFTCSTLLTLISTSVRSQDGKDSMPVLSCATGKLHPSVAHALNTWLKNSKMIIRDYSPDTLSMQRKLDSSFPKSDVRTVRITRDSIAIQILDAVHEKDAPVIIFFHPGAFVTPLLPWMDNMAWQISKTYRAIVFAVDYRVAPKYRYPLATNDCYAALLWVAAHAADYGGDPSKIILYGMSSGATLAAVTAQRAANAGKSGLVKLQILESPSTDHPAKAPEYPSHNKYGVGYGLTNDDIETVTKLYAPDVAPDNFEVSPIRAKDFSKLPPTIVITVEFDPLRDEGTAYATKLKHAGVKTWYKCIPGQIHGLMGLPGDAPEHVEYSTLIKNAMKTTGLQKE